MRLTIITTIAALLGLAVITLHLGGCDSRFRYPCQDPENWGKPECHNAACRADGSCTEQVLGQYYSATESNTSQKVFGEADSTDEKSSSSSSSASSVYSAPSISMRKQIVPKPRTNISSSDSCEINSCPVHTIDSDVEQPVTMDTEVDTHIHNLAAN